jgi:adenosylmethionine-8-amino-7-oxononanoate aminotransferase
MLKMFREADVLLRPLGNTIYVLPPYCISAAELTTLHDAIEQVVRRLVGNSASAALLETA